MSGNSEWELRYAASPVGVNLNESSRIRGMAIVFDSWSEIIFEQGMRFREAIEPSAVDRTLREGLPVKALWNHNRDIVLGSRQAGTLRLQKTPKGLAVEIDPPKWATAQVESIERGDVDGMSFRFMPTADGEEWNFRTADGIAERVITDMTFTEVSIVPFRPAYTATDVTVSKRSLEAFIEAKKEHMGSSIDWLQKLHRTRLI